MVDVDIRGGGPSGTIVWGEPDARRGGAGAVCHHIAAVAHEDDFPDTSQVSWLKCSVVARGEWGWLPRCASAEGSVPDQSLGATVSPTISIKGIGAPSGSPWSAPTSSAGGLGNSPGAGDGMQACRSCGASSAACSLASIACSATRGAGLSRPSATASSPGAEPAPSSLAQPLHR